MYVCNNVDATNPHKIFIKKMYIFKRFQLGKKVKLKINPHKIFIKKTIFKCFQLGNLFDFN